MTSFALHWHLFGAQSAHNSLTDAFPLSSFSDRERARFEATVRLGNSSLFLVDNRSERRRNNEKSPLEKHVSNFPFHVFLMLLFWNYIPFGSPNEIISVHVFVSCTVRIGLSLSHVCYRLAPSIFFPSSVAECRTAAPHCPQKHKCYLCAHRVFGFDCIRFRCDPAAHEI